MPPQGTRLRSTESNDQPAMPDAIEVGDTLTPNYEHYFTRQQVEGGVGRAVQAPAV